MNKNILGIFLISIFLIAACSTSQPATEQTSGDIKPAATGSYKIGVMVPLTGDGAAYGLPIQKAISIAFEEVNANGGVSGKKLEAIYEDSKCTPKDGNAAAQKLINVDKVKLIIGGVCSGETLGAAPLAEQNKVILFSPSATSPDITKAGDFVFRDAPSDAYAGIVAANYAFSDMGGKKAAVISETTDYAQGLRKVFTENFAKLGGEVVADETYNPEDTDFRTQVTKVKAASPDVTYLVPQAPAKGVLLIKQVKEAGVKSKLLTAEVLVGRNVLKENADELEGLVGIEQKVDLANTKTSKLLAKYKQQTNEEAPFPGYMAGGYDIVYLLSDAISKKGYDAEKIKDYLYTVKDYDGAVGKLTIDQNGDPVLDYTIGQVKNGNLLPMQATPHK